MYLQKQRTLQRHSVMRRSRRTCVAKRLASRWFQGIDFPSKCFLQIQFYDFKCLLHFFCLPKNMFYTFFSYPKNWCFLAMAVSINPSYATMFKEVSFQERFFLLWRQEFSTVSDGRTHVSMMMDGVRVVLMGLSRGPLPKPGQGALQPLRVCPTGVPTAPSLRSCTRRRRPER